MRSYNSLLVVYPSEEPNVEEVSGDEDKDRMIAQTIGQDKLMAKGIYLSVTEALLHFEP